MHILASEATLVQATFRDNTKALGGALHEAAVAWAVWGAPVGHRDRPVRAG